MAKTADVTPGATIASAWGNEVRDRTMQVFSTTLERDTQWTAPPNGAVCVTLDTGTTWQRISAAWQPLRHSVPIFSSIAAVQANWAAAPSGSLAVTTDINGFWEKRGGTWVCLSQQGDNVDDLVLVGGANGGRVSLRRDADAWYQAPLIIEGVGVAANTGIGFAVAGRARAQMIRANNDGSFDLQAAIVRLNNWTAVRANSQGEVFVGHLYGDVNPHTTPISLEAGSVVVTTNGSSFAGFNTRRAFTGLLGVSLLAAGGLWGQARIPDNPAQISPGFIGFTAAGPSGNAVPNISIRVAYIVVGW